jgi:hypothetical protein
LLKSDREQTSAIARRRKVHQMQRVFSDKLNSFTADAADIGLEIETVIHSKREYRRGFSMAGSV